MANNILAIISVTHPPTKADIKAYNEMIAKTIGIPQSLNRLFRIIL